MCLYRITNEVDAVEGIGWKVFRKKENGTLETPLFPEEIPMDRWIRAEPVRSALGYCKVHGGSDRTDYRHGFHIFAYFIDAYHFVIPKVRMDGSCDVIKEVWYRDLFCGGRGYGGELQIVAGEIYVPSDREWTLIMEEKDRFSDCDVVSLPLLSTFHLRGKISRSKFAYLN